MTRPAIGANSTPNQRALHLTMRKPVADASRAARQLARAHSDPRFRRNAALIANNYLPTLRMARDQLVAIVAALDAAE